MSFEEPNFPQPGSGDIGPRQEPPVDADQTNPLLMLARPLLEGVSDGVTSNRDGSMAAEKAVLFRDKLSGEEVKITERTDSSATTTTVSRYRPRFRGKVYAVNTVSDLSMKQSLEAVGDEVGGYEYLRYGELLHDGVGISPSRLQSYREAARQPGQEELLSALREYDNIFRGGMDSTLTMRLLISEIAKVGELQVKDRFVVTSTPDSEFNSLLE